MKNPYNEAVELPSEDLIEIVPAGERQKRDVVEAQEVPGFDNIEVKITLQKKPKRGAFERNQDNVLADPETGLVGVFDGVGGRDHGEKASLAAERYLPEHFQSFLKKMKNLDVQRIIQRIVDIMQIKLKQISLPHLVKELEDKIKKDLEKIAETDPEILKKTIALLLALNETGENVFATGGRTTACVGITHQAPNGKTYAIIANVGDSGAFIRRADGSVEMLTRDDALLNQMLSEGLLDEKLLKKMRKNPKKVFEIKKGERNIPITYHDIKRQIGAVLGSEAPDSIPYKPSLEIHRLIEGDELFFATDGILDHFEVDDEPDLHGLEYTLAHLNYGEDSLDALREEAVQRAFMRKTYKRPDDIAAVKVALK
ncbi:MAG: PP2C family protein-serine/threonine phosphatase [Patescibacteria group bacterium]